MSAARGRVATNCVTATHGRDMRVRRKTGSVRWKLKVDRSIMSTAVYPGSFDPITLGHLNVIRRAAAIFDELLVCVMINSGKEPLFSHEERVELIRRTVVRFPNVKVEASQELLVEYMKVRGAKVIIKGLRAVSDFDREFQIALVNRKLDPNIETLLMPSSEKYTYLS